MKNIAVLWDDEVEWDRDKPFDMAANETYEYFSELAAERGVKLFIAKYTWYEDGRLEKTWLYDGEWMKVEDVGIDGVFDKFHFSGETMELKREMKETPGIINDPGLEKLTKDKLLTYQKFPENSPETRKASDENIEKMMDKHGKIVLKPRTAYGAKGIHIVENEEDIPEVSAEDYIVQEFVDSSGGIEGIADGSHDLRAIVVNGEIKGAYVRYNSESEISNVSAGGVKEAVTLEEFPEDALEIVRKVNEKLEYNPSIFSVDIFYDKDDEPYIIELNSKPGLNFFGDEEIRNQVTPMMEELTEAFKQISD